ncbi:hypothetical protein [Burkholderia phage FLC9]|nr:hypothetical protein [Burkholderia phage FLC9]
MNFDEVHIKLDQPASHNLLSETDQMEYADSTDCVESVEVLGIHGEGFTWTAERRIPQPPRQIAFALQRNGKHEGSVVFNTELGDVTLSKDTNVDALEGVTLKVRVTRVNYNRRPRQ